MEDEELRAIAARATTLRERLRGATSHSVTQTDDAELTRRLGAWRQAAVAGAEDAFRRRLAWDGLSLDDAISALGTASSPNGLLPSWTELLREAMREASSPVAANRRVRLQPLEPQSVHGPPETPNFQLETRPTRARDDPPAFPELLEPFMRVARRRLWAAAAPPQLDLLSAEAHATLERVLLSSLAHQAALAFNLEFTIDRGDLWRPAWLRLVAPPERQRYEAFVQRMLEGGLVAFFQEYAVLARQLARMTELWVEAAAEFLARLEADWPDLQAAFGGGPAAGELRQVTELRPALSDPHLGRRSVASVTFANGARAVYKPKDLGMEVAWNALLGWINEHGAPLPFKTLTVLDRGSHGWVEFVEHAACESADQAARYYRRAGMLLCLVYALEGTDCHFENMVARGEHPMLVDLESLLHHRVPPAAELRAQAQVVAGEALGDSVLRTGMLPAWQMWDNGQAAVDISGLGASGPPSSLRTHRWEHSNTDAMDMVERVVEVGSNDSGPALDGKPLRVDDYAAEVTAGFGAMYRLLLDRQEELLAADGPVLPLAGRRVRFIHRATRLYALMLERLRDPKYLRQGIDWGIQLELLVRAFAGLEERAPMWPLVEAEQRAMEQGDIPFFSARTDSAAIEAGCERLVEDGLEGPSFGCMLELMQSLSEEDLARQLGIIRAALFCHGARKTAAEVDTGQLTTAKWLDTAGDADRPGNKPPRCTTEGAGPSVFSTQQSALAIAREICGMAIRGSDGSLAWVAPEYLPKVERFQFQALGSGLYSGQCGIGLFLAAMAATQGEEWREPAMAAVQQLRNALTRRPERLAGSAGGGAAGFGGVLYGLARMGQLLADTALLDDAVTAAALVTEQRIAAADQLDVVLGTAGEMVGLLAVHGVTGDETALKRASLCGRRLLEARTAGPSGIRGWATLDGKLLTGFSHGAAGMAYALLRLFQATGSQEFREAAREAIAFEDSLFVPESGSWPDLRGDGRPSFPAQWCHGAAGIGLGRLGGLAALETPQVRNDIEAALRATDAAGVSVIDQACCGNAGRIELLLEAARKLDRPELLEQARKLAAAVAGRAESWGAYRLHPLLPAGVTSPTLFQGTAGIGYEMLRLAYPAVVPSLLLFE